MWSVDYNLASGQYPKMVLQDGFYNYLSEYMSLYQGYPDVKGFKAFQYPEFPFQQGITAFQQLPIKNTYTYIYPHPEYNDAKQKDFTLEQFSENEGMIVVNGFKVVELPNNWQNLTITPVDQPASFAYQVPEVTSYKSLLPSLKKITTNLVDKKDPYVLLKYNEGYDKQWGAYSSVVEAVLGRRIDIQHAQCDGYANCFLLPVEAVAEGKNVYLYYWPQTLSFIGWIITGITIFGAWKLLRRSHTKN
jgi:hypothetical protein